MNGAAAGPGAEGYALAVKIRLMIRTVKESSVTSPMVDGLIFSMNAMSIGHCDVVDSPVSTRWRRVLRGGAYCSCCAIEVCCQVRRSTKFLEMGVVVEHKSCMLM